MNRHAITASAALALLAFGCHQVTEYQSSESSCLVFIRTEDLQVEKVMDDIPGGRSAIPHGSDELLVISSDGTLYRIDMETLSVDTSFSIGGSSGSGYGDAVIASNGNLYTLGAGSQVIEVDLESNAVLDNFTPGSYPVTLAASQTMGRVYFIDAYENYIGEIMTLTNHTGFTSITYYPLADLMVEPTGGEYIIAVCSNESGSFYRIRLNLSSSAGLIPYDMQAPCSAVIPMTTDSLWAVCCPRWSSSSGRIGMFTGYNVPGRMLTRSVTGHPIAMCFNENSGSDGYLSVLSRTDAGGTAVSVFSLDPYHVDLRLEGEIDLDGIPRDVVSPGPGEYIIVLTSE